MSMEVSITRVASLRVKYDWMNFTCWADYEWYDKAKVWRCESCNEGWHYTTGIPQEFTEEEMSLYLLQAKQ